MGLRGIAIGGLHLSPLLVYALLDDVPPEDPPGPE